MRFGKWFKGVAVAPGGGPTVPPWPGSGPFTITTVQINSNNGAGILYGYMNGMNYGEVGPQGTCNASLFIDTRSGSPVVTEFVGIVSQGNGYIVWGWKSSEVAADPLTMPPMTWQIRVNGATVYDFIAGVPAGTGPPVSSIYITENINWAPGQTHTLEFI